MYSIWPAINGVEIIIKPEITCPLLAMRLINVLFTVWYAYVLRGG
jgi:hypothetical protein